MSALVAVPIGAVDLWEAEGRGLGERERSSRALMWDVGDWWNRGANYQRAEIVSAKDWTGPILTTCQHCGPVAAMWGNFWRQKLSYEHFRIAGARDDARALIEWCLETDPPRTTRQLATRIKQVKRSVREEDLAEAIDQASVGVGHQVYGVLYADPPWRFEPYSIEGMDRAADNHYPTMTRDALFDLEAMRSAPAKDCVLFCWATVPMLEDALEWMAEYGFVYRSHCVWVKDRPGTGYWFRNQHELLLVGVRGEVPAPAPGTQFPSVMEAPVGRHSAKPAKAHEMIEALFPTVAKLELFARAPRAGWDAWGAEAEVPEGNR